MTTEADRPSRRTFALGLASLSALGGCANPSLFVRNVRALSPNLWGAAPKGLTRDEVAQFAAASVSVAVGRGLARLLLLQRVEGPDHFWGAGTTVLQTRGARVVATGGLAHDLTGTGDPDADPAQGNLADAVGKRCRRTLDFSDDTGVGLVAVSEFEAGGTETLTILDVHIKTTRINEHVRVGGLSWRHTNSFWFESQSGQVWKSRQHTHPDLAAVTVTTLRPSNV